MKHKCLKVPFTNGIGQVINVGDPVIMISTGYSHSINTIKGNYEGLVNNQPRCSYDGYKTEYVDTNGKIHSYWPGHNSTRRRVATRRNTVLRLGRVYKLDMGEKKVEVAQVEVAPVVEKLAKERIEYLLAKSVVTVTFKKVNGDLRIMDCTTNMQFVPPSSWPSNGKSEVSNSDKTIRVYDVIAEGWRSFLVENVIEVSYK